MEKVLEALRCLRIGMIIDEYALQEKITAALIAAGIGFAKEYRLGTGSRVDFLTEGGCS